MIFAITFVDYEKRNGLATVFARIKESTKDKEEFNKAIYELYPQFKPYGFIAVSMNYDLLEELLSLC